MSDGPIERETQSIHRDSEPRGIAQRFAESRAEAQPERIGPYRILQSLGEGGMGVVYLAEQEKPIHRRVALKIIKLGMDTKQVVARFDTEREALALMNHPNVAKVFDAGITEQGRPYFAMEYVPGIPITDYCDKQRLTTKERLNLFMDVCHAVQHAHQKGIIHRDIKPGNVLVSVTQDPPIPPLIRGGEGGSAQAKWGMATPPLAKGGRGGVLSNAHQHVPRLDVPVDDPLLVCVLYRMANIHEQIQPLLGGQSLLIAVLGDGYAGHVLHSEVRPALLRGPGVEDLGHVGVVHQRECFPLRVKAGDNLLGVHPQLDDLEGHPAMNGLLLLG